jgi:hypothetical protein
VQHKHASASHVSLRWSESIVPILHCRYEKYEHKDSKYDDKKDYDKYSKDSKYDK